MRTGSPRGSAPPSPRSVHTAGASCLAWGGLSASAARGGPSQACAFFKERGGQLLRPNGWERGALVLSSSHRLK